MYVRVLILPLTAIMLSACSSTWDSQPPRADAGGTGVNEYGNVTHGAEQTASITRASAYNETGTVQPFGSTGENSAYEFTDGYRIGSGDQLTIRVAGQKELTADYLVNGSGNISMPLIRSVKVAGLTAPEIEDKIIARLKNGFLRTPSVSVQATNLRPFYILGEVKSAGGFAYRPGMSVQNAIALAGGYGARADQSTAMITRKTAQGTDTFKVPVTTQLYPGDIVFVRERWF